ncbi:MAG: D-alanyl-D-alanine carboxypeptidase [Rhodobacteraceae bacterium]|nr:D-alanyl-D-alanine carboxypeptidase [Paracoccaceae bacterium]
MARKAAAWRRFAVGVTAALIASGAAAQSLDTAARNAIVFDYDTGAILLEKAADEQIPPASMSKLMTAAMVFEALKQGRLQLDDTFPVSENAYRKEGSTMFLNLTDRPRVADLLRGIIVQSGNDACIALAEGLAGSERAFAEQMTRRARELGMNGSTFANATGLPHPDHVMSVRDLAILASHIIHDYPDFYGFYQEREFSWAGVRQPNRNPLLYLDIGGDGLKTGHTEEAGYGLVGSAMQDGRRVVTVLAGLPSHQARSREAERVISWAFREFKLETLATKGEVVGRAEVWLGASGSVPLAVAKDVQATVPWSARGERKARIIYSGPVPAPIEEGQPIGELIIEVPGVGPMRAPLVAAESVPEGGYVARLMAGLSIFVDWLAAPPPSPQELAPQ